MSTFLDWLGGIAVGASGTVTWFTLCRIHAVRARLPWWFKI